MGDSIKKQSRIDIRISDDIKELIEKAALLTGTSVSSYIISKTLASAKEDVREMENVYLGKADREIFIKLINKPPTANDELKKLMKKTYEIDE